MWHRRGSSPPQYRSRSRRRPENLEYRGYDSAGLAVIGASAIERVRSVGRVAELETASASTQSVTGIAHTRWAAHGVPCERNAHPHVSGSIAVVHNGIIENYESLRNKLTAQGYVFTSDTDTESIAHLIEATLKNEPDLFNAVQIACRRLVGVYAIAVIDQSQPGKIVVAREGSPLLQVTRNMVHLENRDIAELTPASARITRLDGTPVDRPVHVSQLSADAVEFGNYQHYMQKEIFNTGIRKTVQWYLDHQAWVQNVTSGAYREWVGKSTAVLPAPFRSEPWFLHTDYVEPRPGYRFFVPFNKAISRLVALDVIDAPA